LRAASPRSLAASSSSAASFSCMVLPERERAYWMIQRIASAVPRSPRTSTGT
jgi:hypothetical protein